MSSLVHATIVALVPTPTRELVTWASLVGAPAVGRSSTPGDGPTDASQTSERMVDIDVLAGGPPSRDNLDAFDRGTGGAPRAALVTLLVSRTDSTTLTDTMLNAVDAQQIQRIRTDVDRASYEDRRATPHPSTTPFLASGHGDLRERREIATRDPREGARVWSATRTDEAQLAVDDRAAHGQTIIDRSTRGARTDASRAARGDRGEGPSDTARGALDTHGHRRSAAADVAFGRPDVDRGPAATLAVMPGPVRDDTDSELLAASLTQSRVDASERGAGRGHGVGGTTRGAGGGAGGGEESGGRASAFAPGAGESGALDTRDARYRTWFLDQRRRIETNLHFPRDRALEMDQGTTVVRVRVARDGGVLEGPRIVRSSGFADFDAAALEATRRALPFPRIPTDIAPGAASLALVIPIEFANPLVGR